MAPWAHPGPGGRAGGSKRTPDKITLNRKPSKGRIKGSLKGNYKKHITRSIPHISVHFPGFSEFFCFLGAGRLSSSFIKVRSPFWQSIGRSSQSWSRFGLTLIFSCMSTGFLISWGCATSHMFPLLYLFEFLAPTSIPLIKSTSLTFILYTRTCTPDCLKRQVVFSWTSWILTVQYDNSSTFQWPC